jgi:hypothetical protein
VVLNRKIFVLPMDKAAWNARCLMDQQNGVRLFESKTAATTAETSRCQKDFNAAFAEKLSRASELHQASILPDMLEVIDLKDRVDKADMRCAELFARLLNAQKEESVWNKKLIAAKNTLATLQQHIQRACDQCKDGIDDSLSQKVQTRDE